MSFLSDQPLDLGALVARVTAPERGGIACFVGVVRDHHEGRGVLRLEYSAYDAMAEAECARIAAELTRVPDDELLAIFDAARKSERWDQDELMRILAQHPRDSKGYFSKIELVTAYQQLTDAGLLPFEREVLRSELPVMLDGEHQLAR